MNIEAQRPKVVVLALLMVLFGGGSRVFTHGHRWPTILSALCVVVLALVQFAKLEQMEKR